MSLPALDNLVRIGQLKAEPSNPAETHRMLTMARTRLEDAQLPGLSQQGRFTSAYNAAHAAALAALRWHGYRSENRYTVFQCLTHTLGWPATRWRVFGCRPPETSTDRINHLYQDPTRPGAPSSCTTATSRTPPASSASSSRCGPTRSTTWPPKPRGGEPRGTRIHSQLRRLGALR